MTDAASAPMETAAPLPDASTSPVETTAPAATSSNDAPARSEKPNIRDSLDKAFAKVEADDADKPAGERAGERTRDAQGRFAANADQQAAQAPQQGQQPPATTAQQQQRPGLETPPARFSADAKAAWAQAPEAVRGEINRAVAELEQGINSYRERYASVEPFARMAQESGTTLDAALTSYVGIERTLRADPANGMELILSNIGMTPMDYAQMVMGQAQQPNAQDNTIRELRAHIARLEQHVGGVAQTMEQQQQAAVDQTLADFARDKPRFGELRQLMGQLMSANMAPDLTEAYAMAERLRPAPAQAMPPAVAAAPATTPAPQTGKGKLSITGAPSSGSNPALRQPAKTRQEAIDRAFAQVGLA